MNDEYLTIKDVAARLKLSPKTVRNKMAAGVFQRGVHYFARHCLAPRFKWPAVVAWLEQHGAAQAQGGIPMARGYQLGHGQAKRSTPALDRE